MSTYVQTRQTCPGTAIYVHSKSFVNQKRCFSYNQVGHFMRDCPADKKDKSNGRDDKKKFQVLNHWRKQRPITMVLQAKLKGNRTM